MSTSLTSSNSPNICSFRPKSISNNLTLSPYTISFPLHKIQLRAVKTGSNGSGSGRLGSEAFGSDILRRPVEPVKEYSNDDGEDESDTSSVGGGDGDTWVDWEDQILEDTVPLVGFVRMILHSGKYESGDRLSPEHERTILERLLPYHPEAEKKIGCGIDYITIGYHPNFESSRCLFIVRTDGDMVDFSYWKCIKGLIRKNYPLYADTFIFRHFRKRRRGGD